MKANGFTIMGNKDCAICPVYLRMEMLGRQMELELMRRGIYNIGIGYPVCEIGTGRIRIIITLGHTFEMIDKCVKTFKEVADDYNYWEEIKKYDGELKKNLRRYFVVNWLKSWFVPQED